LHRWRELEREHHALEGLRSGLLTAPGGLIHHRGREIRRRDLAQAIRDVDRERRAAEHDILEHDRLCRSAHRSAARSLGHGWDEYLASLGALLHYAEHSCSNLEDAAGHLDHVLAIVTLDGRVSAAELERVMGAAVDLHGALASVLRKRRKVELPHTLQERLGVSSWVEMLPDRPRLPAPIRQHILPWLQAIGAWILALRCALQALRAATLDELLEAEAYVADCARRSIDPCPAPYPAKTPRRYPILPAGSERPLQQQLGFWDRFQIADGLVPASFRLAVACGVLGAGFLLDTAAHDASVYVYNGLGVGVRVQLEDESWVLQPGQHVHVAGIGSRRVHVQARTWPSNALIEAFEADASNARLSYVYNVASGAPLMETSWAHGVPRAPRRLGAKRWLSSRADVFFTGPVRRTASGSPPARQEVVEAVTHRVPARQIAQVSDRTESRALIRSHARWDDTTTPAFAEWMSAARALPEFEALLSARVRERPQEPFFVALKRELGAAQPLETSATRSSLPVSAIRAPGPSE
jgi:hypothetical protein